MSYWEVIVKLFIYTRSISSSSDISSSALCFLRYEWRLPLAMKGITMYGACPARQIPRIPITWGCVNAIIFRHSFRMFATSLGSRKPKKKRLSLKYSLIWKLNVFCFLKFTRILGFDGILARFYLWHLRGLWLGYRWEGTWWRSTKM